MQNNTSIMEMILVSGVCGGDAASCSPPASEQSKYRGLGAPPLRAAHCAPLLSPAEYLSCKLSANAANAAKALPSRARRGACLLFFFSGDLPAAFGWSGARGWGGGCWGRCIIMKPPSE